MTTTRMLAAPLLFLSLTACTAAHREQPAHTTLAATLREELQRDAPLDVQRGSPLEAVNRLHFIFVGGFLSEGIPGYFNDNIAVTQELGATTSTLFPSSLGALEDDCALILDAVASARAQTGRKIVLVGHSKGGAGVLLTALRHPELMQSGQVDRVIVIQGAVRGSPLADLAVDGGSLRSSPVRLRPLESLTRRDSEATFTAALSALHARLPPREVEALEARIFYVRSSQGDSVAPVLALPHLYLSSKGSGRNDGLLLEEDMKLDEGVDLGVLEADHAALTVSSALSNQPPELRRAFTRALYREVFSR